MLTGLLGSFQKKIDLMENLILIKEEMSIFEMSASDCIFSVMPEKKIASAGLNKMYSFILSFFKDLEKITLESLIF